jgi:hypothetical protein
LIIDGDYGGSFIDHYTDEKTLADGKTWKLRKRYLEGGVIFLMAVGKGYLEGEL